jgi:hypothetical protein
MGLNTRKGAYLREESAFPHGIGTPPPLTSIPEPDFQQFDISSRPRWYCQKTQPPDPVKYFPKKYPRNSHLCHLKYHVPRMIDHLGSDLDELFTQRSQRQRRQKRKDFAGMN